jgi:hypothetical protein
MAMPAFYLLSIFGALHRQSSGCIFTRLHIFTVTIPSYTDTISYLPMSICLSSDEMFIRYRYQVTVNYGLYGIKSRAPYLIYHVRIWRDLNFRLSIDGVSPYY